MTARTLLIIAGAMGALGIVIGAFGAHALPNILKDLPEPELLKRKEWLETGVKYHMYHVAALLAIALAGEDWAGRFSSVGIAWLVGILTFSGCLYTMSLTGIKVLGAIVPIGGVSFILGWTLLVIAGLRSKP